MAPSREKKKHHIEIILENAEFEELRSLGDKSGSEDVADNNHIIEEPESEKPDQEEILRKRKSGSLETQESNQPYQKRPRKKSSR